MTETKNPQSKIAEPLLTEDEEDSFDLKEQIAFLKKPRAERNRILAEQAEALLPHYEQDAEWKEWLTGDIVEY